MTDLAARVREASASIVFEFAVVPGHAHNMRDMWGGKVYDAAAVKAEFGEDAAKAWADAADARQRFFAAVKAKFSPDYCACACDSKGPCEHEFSGWREFENGGEQVCTRCGMGAIQHTLSATL